VEAEIVEDDSARIAGESDVEFRSVAAVLQGEVEGRESVLRSVTAGAAMAQQ